MSSRVLVTGGNGFIGHAVVERLLSEGESVVAQVRKKNQQQQHNNLEIIETGALEDYSDMQRLMSNIDTVIHTAGRAHVTSAEGHEVEQVYHRINTEVTERLAQQAVAAGVKRFVFLSTIHVNGKSSGNTDFISDQVVNPQLPYAVSKWRAEQLLHEIAISSSLEVVIIRLPLVYGPGVKGNLASLLGLLNRGTPLPFGNISNKRSLIGLSNLVDIIVRACCSEKVIGKTLLVSDYTVSTTELVRQFIQASASKTRLLSFPTSLLRFLFSIIGKDNLRESLLENLSINAAEANALLDWQPKISFADEVQRCVEWYKTNELRH